MQKSADERPRRIEALQERVSRLSAAVLRISASLDLGAVLREVVDSARALTGARYGVITTIDKPGQVQDFVTSGFTPDEHQQLAAWPDGRRLFAHHADRHASRAGTVPSAVVLGGRKVAMQRPRVRAEGREVPLPTFQAVVRRLTASHLL